VLSDVNERSEFTDERHVTESLSPSQVAWRNGVQDNIK